MSERTPEQYRPLTREELDTLAGEALPERAALYYYVGDRQPGQILCQDVFEFGGTWLVVRPNGTLVR
jgi:hypothetical protein